MHSPYAKPTPQQIAEALTSSTGNEERCLFYRGCRFSAEEERVVLELQAQFGNRWARIATYLPGRTDNDVKNFWSTRQKRLARLLRAPMPRRRPGKQSSGASSSHAYDYKLPAPKVTDCCLYLVSLFVFFFFFS